MSSPSFFSLEVWVQLIYIQASKDSRIVIKTWEKEEEEENEEEDELLSHSQRLGRHGRGA